MSKDMDTQWIWVSVTHHNQEMQSLAYPIKKGEVQIDLWFRMQLSSSTKPLQLKVFSVPNIDSPRCKTLDCMIGQCVVPVHKTDDTVMAHSLSLGEGIGTVHVSVKPIPPPTPTSTIEAVLHTGVDFTTTFLKRHEMERVHD